MQPTHDKVEIDLGEYFTILRRRWAWIVGTVVLLTGLVLARDLSQDPVYAASAQLLLQSKASENIFQPSAAPSDPARAVQNELRIINSRVVRLKAQQAYGAPIAVSATAGGQDDVIVISATSTDPDEAARKANVYAETYQTARIDALLDDITTARDALQRQIDDLQGQIDLVNLPLAQLDQQIVDTAPDDPRLSALQAQRDTEARRTEAERSDMEAQLAEYQERLQLLQLSERLTTTGGVQILNPAGAPSEPISPRIVRDMVQALLVSAILGVILAFVRDQFDDSIRSRSDVQRAIRGVPVLAMIPADNDWRSGDDARLGTVRSPTSAVAEAFRGLRTSIQYLSLQDPLGLVLVTSSNANEGKSGATANLAVAFARAGKKVAVVGCDLRKPRLHDFLEVDPGIGLTTVLLGEASLEEAIQTSPIEPNIDVLTSGPLPPNPSELLSLDRTAALLHSLKARYHMVFIDTPPVLPVTDALVLSRYVDGTIFLVASQRTSRRDARRAVEMLLQVDSPLVGTILNGVMAEDAYQPLYQYYGLETKKTSPFDWLRRRPKVMLPTADTSHVVDESREDDTTKVG